MNWNVYTFSYKIQLWIQCFSTSFDGWVPEFLMDSNEKSQSNHNNECFQLKWNLVSFCSSDGFYIHI